MGRRRADHTDAETAGGEEVNRVDIHIGDCREVLETLDAASVQTVVTSPPYWGMREYGGGESVVTPR